MKCLIFDITAGDLLATIKVAMHGGWNLSSLTRTEETNERNSTCYPVAPLRSKGVGGSGRNRK